jgi:Transglutaminase-like superfamily
MLLEHRFELGESTEDVVNAELEFYASHSPFTDPGRFAGFLETLPTEVPAVCKALQGIVVHYVGSGIQFTPERLEQIDSRRVENILARLSNEADTSLNLPRAPDRCFVGCCRDFSTVFVAAMRARGVPARTRIGFAPYLRPDFNHDHVVAEYWNGSRWVMVDPQIPPGFAPFDVQDIPAGRFVTASSAWRAWRHGELNADLYGVAPQLPYRGDWFIRNYVVLELAALNKYETLLWDQWGVMSGELTGDLELIDRAADTLLRGDWNEVRALHDATLEFQVSDSVTCYSPTGKVRSESLWR